MYIVFTSKLTSFFSLKKEIFRNQSKSCIDRIKSLKLIQINRSDIKQKSLKACISSAGNTFIPLVVLAHDKHLLKTLVLTILCTYFKGYNIVFQGETTV